MGDWKDLLKRQMEERVALFQNKIDLGLTKSQIAKSLGMSRQSVYQFCKLHNLKSKNNEVIE